MTAVVLVLTAVWHGLAAYHFTLFPGRSLARSTRERPVNVIAAELFRFLGALNLALVLLALVSLAVPPSQRWTALLTLAAANASQFVVDWRVRRMDLARGSFFTQILIGDGIFTALNLAALAVSLSEASG